MLLVFEKEAGDTRTRSDLVCACLFFGWAQFLFARKNQEVLCVKEIRTVDAVGQVLCHDLTQIIRGVTKDARFRKGHVIAPEDIDVLLSMGKDHVFVWEADEAVVHEDEAAEVLRELLTGAPRENMPHMEAKGPKEGKIELIATVDGVFSVDAARIDALNDLDDISIATVPQQFPVKAGQKLAGMRVIPLVCKRSVLEEAKKRVAGEPIVKVLPYRKDLRVGVVTTGTEVFLGRIEDTFTPVLEAKLKAFGLTITEHRKADDDKEHIATEIRSLLDAGMDLILCTGGMSVDPDDRTPAAIRRATDEIVTYGAPILPGAMFLVAYKNVDSRTVPVLGLPGCVMYAPATVLDMYLPRLVAGERIERSDIRKKGVGGLCMNCKVCHYPRCTFGRS